MPLFAKIKKAFSRNSIPDGTVRLEQLTWTKAGRRKWKQLLELPTSSETAKKLISNPTSYEEITDWPQLGDGYYRLRLITPNERRTVWTVFVELDEDGAPNFEEDPRIPRRPPEEELEAELLTQQQPQQPQGPFMFSPEAINQLQQAMAMVGGLFQATDQLKEQFAQALGISTQKPKDSKEMLREVLQEMEEWRRLDQQLRGKNDNSNMDKILDKMPWWAAFAAMGLQNLGPLLMMGMSGRPMGGLGMGGMGGMMPQMPPQYQQPQPQQVQRLPQPPTPSNQQPPAGQQRTAALPSPPTPYNPPRNPAPPRQPPEPAPQKPNIAVSLPTAPKPRVEPAPVRPPQVQTSTPQPKQKTERQSNTPPEYDIDPDEFTELLKNIEVEENSALLEQQSRIPEKIEKDLTTEVNTAVQPVNEEEE